MSERRPELDDPTAEALLAGTTPPAPELQPLAVFVNEVRATAAGPANPRAGLAARMAAGNFADVSSRATWHSRLRAGQAGPQVTKLPRWRRAQMAVTGLLAAVTAKIAGMGLTAKAATGLTVAAASVTGAAATGALPDAAQERVEQAVESVTPFEFSKPVADDAVTDLEFSEEADQSEFGKEVAEDAVDGGVDGQEVSEKARELGNQPDSAPAGPESPTGKPSSPPVPDAVPDPADSADPAPADLPVDPPTGSDHEPPVDVDAEPETTPAPDKEPGTVPDRP